jgi:hypothetical protein
MVGIYKGVKRKVSENRVAKTGLPYCCPMVFCGSPIFPLPTIRIPPTFFFLHYFKDFKTRIFLLGCELFQLLCGNVCTLVVWKHVMCLLEWF